MEREYEARGKGRTGYRDGAGTHHRRTAWLSTPLLITRMPQHVVGEKPNSKSIDVSAKGGLDS